MDFGLSETQVLLRETAERFVAETCPPEQAKEWDDAHHYPAELFRSFAELGWFEMAFPVSEGGGGAGAVELSIIAEALGRASLDVAQCFILTLMGGMFLQRWGTEEQRRAILPSLMRGETRLSLGMSEPDAGSDLAALRTTADDKGDYFVVNGQKMWCTGAGLPGTQILCYVRTDRDAPKHSGLSVMLVDPSAPGVELRPIDTLARHILGTYEVYLDDVAIPRSRLVGVV